MIFINTNTYLCDLSDITSLSHLKELISDKLCIPEKFFYVFLDGTELTCLKELYSSCNLTTEENKLTLARQKLVELNINKKNISRYYRNKNYEIIDLWVKSDQFSLNGYNFLSLGVNSGDLDVISYILVSGVEIKQEYKLSTFSRVCRHGELATVLKLVALLSVDLDILMENNNYRKQCPLVAACIVGSVEVLEWLLRNGSNPNGNGSSIPLCSCIDNNDCQKLLLEYGADVNFENKYCHTPMQFAVLNDSIVFLEFLLRNGAEINGGSYSPLSAAIETEDMNILQFLLDKGAEIRPEHIIESIEFDNYNVFKLLIDNIDKETIDMNYFLSTFDEFGVSPITKAIIKNNSNILDEIRKLLK